MTSDKLVNYLKLYTSFTESEESLIREQFPTATYKEGEYLCQIGEVCRTINFICSGVLRIFSTTERGVEKTHFFLKENQLCCVLESFTEQIPSMSAIEAACETEVILIHRHAMNNVFAKIPRLEALLNQIIQRSLIEKISMRNEYLGENATARYQKFLIRQPDISTRVSMSHIASYLNITPQSLSRIRKEIS